MSEDQDAQSNQSLEREVIAQEDIPQTIIDTFENSVIQSATILAGYAEILAKQVGNSRLLEIIEQTRKQIESDFKNIQALKLKTTRGEAVPIRKLNDRTIFKLPEVLKVVS